MFCCLENCSAAYHSPLPSASLKSLVRSQISQNTTRMASNLVPERVLLLSETSRQPELCCLYFCRHSRLQKLWMAHSVLLIAFLGFSSLQLLNLPYSTKPFYRSMSHKVRQVTLWFLSLQRSVWQKQWKAYFGSRFDPIVYHDEEVVRLGLEQWWMPVFPPLLLSMRSGP